MTMKWSWLVLIVPLATTPVIPEALGQVNPFKSSELESFTDADNEMLKAAAKALYTADSPAVGARGEWSNSDTGNQGTVEILDVYEWKTLPCRKIRYQIKLAGKKDVVDIMADRCQVESGEWKLKF